MGFWRIKVRAGSVLWYKSDYMKVQLIYLNCGEWWLESSVGRALHWFRRGHGFKSRSGLKIFFQASQSYLHIILCSSNVWTFIYSLVITNSHSDQLPVCLITHLLEHCAGIAEVTGSNPIQAWIFFQALISQVLKLYAYLRWSITSFILCSSNIWTFIYSLVFQLILLVKFMLLLFLFFKLKRQREGKASPLRHSKDDSDTIDLAPSHFPPLPTSPLPLFVSILALII